MAANIVHCRQAVPKTICRSEMFGKIPSIHSLSNFGWLFYFGDGADYLGIWLCQPASEKTSA
jgi:hypothetical protein